MKNRVIAGAAALAVVVALVGLAVVAGRDSGSKDPATLPVLGAGGGEAAPMAADSATDMRFAGPVEYRYAGKLPGLADEADAWKLRSDAATVDRIAELAKVLGVEGEVTKGEYGWTVADGPRRLDGQDVAGNPWSLYESVPEQMVDPEVQARDAVSSMPAQDIQCIKAPCDPPSDCAADDCDHPQMPERPADLPSKAEAERIGRDLLGELGVDLEGADVRVEDGVTIWNVSADPILGGLPTIGFTSSVGVGPKGAVKYGNGWLGTAEHGDTYPLIGTAEGLKQLSSQQARVLMVDPAVSDCVDCPEAEPIIVTVTGVRLGLQLFSTFERGADAYLVPSYFFSTNDGGEIPVIAVAEEFLGQTPQHEEEPGHDEPGTPAEPVAPDQGGGTSGSGGETCETADGEGVSATVCVSAAEPGGVTTFRVVAKGPLRDDCASPTAEFGDEGDGMATCMIACETAPTEPIELERTFEHTYAKAGNYDAVVHFWGCGAESGTDQLSVPILVRVEG